MRVSLRKHTLLTPETRKTNDFSPSYLSHMSFKTHFISRIFTANEQKKFPYIEARRKIAVPIWCFHKSQPFFQKKTPNLKNSSVLETGEKEKSSSILRKKSSILASKLNNLLVARPVASKLAQCSKLLAKKVG